MNILVATSTVSDGSMLSKSNDADQVVINRRLYLERFGISIQQTTRLAPETLSRATIKHETDWCRYVELTEQDKGSGMLDDTVIVADAIITKSPNHCLLLPVADCVGTVIYDPLTHILMVSHLGRHSLEQLGGQKSITHLVTHYGSRPQDLQVWFTPAPNATVFPIWALDNRGMKEVAFEQLMSAGVPKANINDNPADTATDTRYFSYSEFLKGNRPYDGDHAIIAMMTDAKLIA
jgi:copper oxidase (laccase) domain-containing protein